MIRLAENEADLQVCVSVCNEVQPDDPVAIGQLERSSGTFLLHGDHGYAFVDRSSVPGSAYAMVRVRPGVRRRGVGSALLVAARERAAESGCAELWSRVRNDESLGFVRRRGFEEVMREVNVLLEVAPGDGELGPGIRELEERHLEGAYRVVVECMPESAGAQQAEAEPFGEWVERVARRTTVALVALDDGEVVGFASLHETGLPERLEHGLTAVRRSHRRRGIATALKRAQIAWAAERGYRELVTEMVEANTGMRGVNERLGYRPLPPSIVVSGRAA